MTPANDTCAGARPLSWGGTALNINGDSSCAADQLAFAAGGCASRLNDGTPGRDLFFRITLQPGEYRIRLKTPGWDSALYLLAKCGTDDCLDASDQFDPGAEESLTVSVNADTGPVEYLVGIDSFDPAAAGEFALVVESTLASADAGPPDATASDIGADGAGADAGPVSALVITEIMTNPKAVADSSGEWFELYNPGATAIDLAGWRIEDLPGASQEKHTIAASIIVPAGGYAVLGNNTDKANNGGVMIDYAYPASWQLANSSDEIFLFDAAGRLVDSVSYATGWPLKAGASLSLKAGALDNGLPTSWCAESAPWSGSAGDSGTPGSGPGCQ